MSNPTNSSAHGLTGFQTTTILTELSVSSVRAEELVNRFGISSQHVRADLAVWFVAAIVESLRVALMSVREDKPAGQVAH